MWTVFAVPPAAVGRLWEACRSLLDDGEDDLAALTLIRGDEIGGRIPLAIRVVTGNFASYLEDCDGNVLARPLGKLLGTEVWAITGDSHTDDLDVECYRAGRSGRTELEPWVVGALCEWAGFGISGADPDGLVLPLGDAASSRAQEEAYAAARAGGDPDPAG